MPTSNDDVTDDHQLVAGTAWLFARAEHREAFDLLFIDEAGQFALANAAAVSLAATNVVLLGDPQQLPQVTQADHPDGSGASVLEHLLDGAQHDRRPTAACCSPRPGACTPTSARSSPSAATTPGCTRAPPARNRRIDAPVGALTGAGLRSIAVDHEGRSQASPEEADAIAAACRDLLAGATVTDDDGHDAAARSPTTSSSSRPTTSRCDCIRERVPAGVRVGTVDRFQGQQAPVVFYAMTCSAGEDVPRGIDFLFDAHRLNVAISRAQCLAVLVHSPRLLDADCQSLAAMELVDGVCRFVELAEPVAWCREQAGSTGPKPIPAAGWHSAASKGSPS